jgi:hypothetical protein
MVVNKVKSKRFDLKDNLNDPKMAEFLSWTRFCEFSGNILELFELKDLGRAQIVDEDCTDSSDDDFEVSKAFNGTDLPAISISNEKKTLSKIKQIAEHHQTNWTTSLEEDLDLL